MRCAAFASQCTGAFASILRCVLEGGNAALFWKSDADGLFSFPRLSVCRAYLLCLFLLLVAAVFLARLGLLFSPLFVFAVFLLDIFATFSTDSAEILEKNEFFYTQR